MPFVTHSGHSSGVATLPLMNGKAPASGIFDLHERSENVELARGSATGIFDFAINGAGA